MVVPLKWSWPRTESPILRPQDRLWVFVIQWRPPRYHLLLLSGSADWVFITGYFVIGCYNYWVLYFLGVFSIECLTVGCFTVGCFTVGCFTVGCFSVGCSTVGCFTVGCFSVGCFSVGCFSVGCFTVGCFTIGCFFPLLKKSRPHQVRNSLHATEYFIASTPMTTLQ